MPSPSFFNIAQHLPEMARIAPDRAAIICTHAPDDLGRTRLTFSELDRESDALAWGLSGPNAVRAGERVLLAVRPGLDFIALTFALFKIGAVPVLIDPGMGRANFVNCVKRVRPDVVIGIRLALSLIGGNARKILAGRSWLNWTWRGPRVSAARKDGLAQGQFSLAKTSSDSLAATLFTSGGTGIPKGVCYEHGMFGAQVELIRDHFKIEPGEIDLPAFPLFALFSTAMGVTSVIPDMNPSRPARCNPDKIIDALQSQKVTYTFGSPAIWKRVGPRCVERKIQFTHLKRILMAGAPVRGEVLAPFAKILPSGGDVFIPYGATEALPVCSIRGSEVLNETWALTRQGKGYCVGHPLPRMTVKIIAPDEHVENASRLPERPTGEIGEIVVQGPVVTKEYFEMPEETAKAKIGDPRSGNFWHRMGDMGYIDATGRVWFCGRKAHRVNARNGKPLYSVCCEAVFEEFMRNQFSINVRAALVNATSGAALVVEIAGQKIPRGVQTEIVTRWKSEALAQDIGSVLFYAKPFPVDVRHNAKIDREALGRWSSNLKQ